MTIWRLTIFIFEMFHNNLFSVDFCFVQQTSFSIFWYFSTIVISLFHLSLRTTEFLTEVVYVFPYFFRTIVLTNLTLHIGIIVLLFIYKVPALGPLATRS